MKSAIVLKGRRVDHDREIVGAIMVDDVRAYEMMKIRVLNGGHSAISCGENGNQTPQ